MGANGNGYSSSKLIKNNNYKLTLFKQELNVLSICLSKEDVVEILTLGVITKTLYQTNTVCRIRTIRQSGKMNIVFEDPDINLFFIEIGVKLLDWKALFLEKEVAASLNRKGLISEKVTWKSLKIKE